MQAANRSMVVLLPVYQPGDHLPTLMTDLREAAPGCHVVEEGPRAYALSRLGRTWRVEFSGDDVRCETRSAEVSERYGLFEGGIQLVVSSVRLLQSVWSRANGS